MRFNEQEQTISEWQKIIEPWLNYNFPNDTTELTALGLGEESGEVQRAVLKRAQNIRGTHQEWTAEMRKEIGDVFIVLMNIARCEGILLSDVIAERWAVVSMRDWQKDTKGHGIKSEKSNE